jgi:hypothetical protein
MIALKSDAKVGLIAVDDAGQEFVGVVPLRLFPLSDPDCWIALLGEDGREIAVISDPKELDESSRKLLEVELGRREFVPIVRQILWVSGNSEPCSMRVDTDRGRTEFVLKNDDDIRRLGPSSVLIVDSHGIRYLIPNRDALDPYSRRIVEWYV